MSDLVGKYEVVKTILFDLFDELRCHNEDWLDSVVDDAEARLREASDRDAALWYRREMADLIDYVLAHSNDPCVTFYAQRLKDCSQITDNDLGLVIR